MGDRFPPGRNVLLDIGAARTDLGYEPRYDVPAALADMRSQGERATASEPD
jgi:nucleoside-diphosphate-sugar epimerase